MAGFKKTVLGALGSRFMAQARVEEVDVLSNQFRRITLSSDKFKNAAMQPASKVRVNAGEWEMRAYTPLSIDAATGRLQILAYLHGEGPGSIWARSAVPGDTTHILGPQPSLNLMGPAQAAVFFGDETSLAAAKTLQSHLSPQSATRFVLEVSSAVEARAVGERLELRNAEYYERQPNGAHLAVVTEAIQHALGSTATTHLVMTGNGRSIQAIRSTLRSLPSVAIDYHVKAYWAPGKVGLE